MRTCCIGTTSRDNRENTKYKKQFLAYKAFITSKEKKAYTTIS